MDTSIKAFPLKGSLLPPKIDIKEKHPTDPRLAMLKTQLSDELGTSNWFLWEYQYWYFGCILLCILLVSTVTICKYRHRKKSEIFRHSYLSKEDKVPGSWARAYVTNHKEETFMPAVVG